MKLTRETENLIADLRGVPADGGPASFNKLGRPYNWRNLKERNYRQVREAIPVENLIEVLVERLKLEQPRPEEMLMRHWRDILGDEYAHRCSPQKIVAGRRLIVAVGNAIARQELHFQRRQILARIGQYAGLGGIREIVFRAG